MAPSVGNSTKSSSRSETMAECGNHRSTESSTAEWMEKIEENMMKYKEENKVMLKSMMDRLERMMLDSYDS